MSNLLTGKVTHILEPVSGESKRNPGQKWVRQNFVIETLDIYPRNVAFSMFGEDRIKQANIQMNEIITIEYEINSREYEGRWYTDIQCRNVFRGNEAQQLLAQQMVGAGGAAAYPQGNNAGGQAYTQTQNNFGPANAQANPQPNNAAGNTDATDDLPF